MSIPVTTITEEPALPQNIRPIASTIAYYAGFIALGLSVASLGPTLPSLAQHTRTNLGEISFLFTAHALGYLLGSFQGGRLYDRMRGHLVLSAALFLMVAMMVLVPTIPALWALTLVVLLLGVSQGTVDVGGNTLLVWVHRNKVGPFMNGLHFFFGVGAFLSPVVIAMAMSRTGDIDWAYWALALMILPAAVLFLYIPSPKDHASSTSQASNGISVMTVVLIASFFFLYVGAESSFGGWIYTYALKRDLANATSAAYLTSAFWGALTVGRLVGIPIAARFRPRTILAADLAGCLASISLILLMPGSLVATWVGTLGMGFAQASIFPTVISLAERRMLITGKVTGWFFVGSSLGGMTLPWLIGQLFERIGPQAAMTAILVDLVISVFVFAALILYRPNLPQRIGQPG